MNGCEELSQQTPLLTDLKEIYAGGMSLLRDMDKAIKEINYSLVGCCDPEVDEQCGDTPCSVKHGLTLLRKMFYKYEDIRRELINISDHLGISDNRIPTGLHMAAQGKLNDYRRNQSESIYSPCDEGRSLSRVNDNQCCTTNSGCCSNERTVPCRDGGECSSKVNCGGPYCEEEKCPNHAC